MQSPKFDLARLRRGKASEEILEYRWKSPDERSEENWAVRRSSEILSTMKATKVVMTTVPNVLVSELPKISNTMIRKIVNFVVTKKPIKIVKGKLDTIVSLFLIFDPLSDLYTLKLGKNNEYTVTHGNERDINWFSIV
jgi:hypothetical protein